MRDRFNRKQNNRLTRNKLLILCCVETEVNYFQLLKSKFKIKDILIEKSSKSDDEIVVNEALYYKLSNNNLNEVWAVFDKDHSTQFNSVIKYAVENDIKCAFSNIAFEYWFYLHFYNDTRVMNIDEIKNELDKQLKFNYDKKPDTIKRVFKMIDKSITTAEDNAMRGHSIHISNYGDDDPASYCSCTTIYQLVDTMRKWNK